MELNKQDLKAFMDEKYLLYNTTDFINPDPISIPHLFSKKEDIEIAGLFAATIAWGQRVTILKNARQLMLWMDDSPFEFIKNHTEKDLQPFKKFVHRTFNGVDCVGFIKSLNHIYLNEGGLELAFSGKTLKEGIVNFRALFFSIPHEKRTEKHISNPNEGSAAKRILMFLRWMIRKDKTGVDFGIWNNFKPADLYCPLDVHSGRVARRLGLLNRTQNDWKAVEELTDSLRTLDPVDPVKYDFALFGLGVNEKF